MTGPEALRAILSHDVTLGTRKQSVADWIEEFRADRGAVLIRVTAGWSLLKALTEPLREPKRWSKRGKASRFRGVTRHSSRRWYSRIFHDGKSIDLGLWDDECEAAAVVNIAARNLRGLSAKVNLL